MHWNSSGTCSLPEVGEVGLCSCGSLLHRQFLEVPLRAQVLYDLDKRHAASQIKPDP